MGRFLQVHLLTSYPPANLNRDDLGRPKTAKMGGVDRLRVSSQSLKRTWRTSDLFQRSLSGHLGTRTKRLGYGVYEQFIEAGIPEKDSKTWALQIAEQFGKRKKEGEHELEIEQLVHIAPAEQRAIDALVRVLIEERRPPQDDELDFLRSDEMAVDIALFGRMLAAKPKYNVEAACQVAHAISVHGVVIEDDYFTAVDDLNDHSEDAGAAHIGETGFAAGLFYSYICINRELLIENLNGNMELANRAISALVEAAVKVAPEGKQNSFASRAYASYVRAEVGDQQPRSLSVAFLKPVAKNEEDFARNAVDALEKQTENFDRAYGPCVDEHYTLDTITPNENTMAGMLEFINR